MKIMKKSNNESMFDNERFESWKCHYDDYLKVMYDIFNRYDLSIKKLNISYQDFCFFIYKCSTKDVI